MRNISRTLPMAIAGLALLFAAPATAQDDETVDWLGDYKEAIQEAKRTNKPIFLEFRCEA